jgi:hypothetical protein
MRIRIQLSLYNADTDPGVGGKLACGRGDGGVPIPTTCTVVLYIHMYTSVYIMRIRIRILIKVMRICDHCSTDPPQLYFEARPAMRKNKDIFHKNSAIP